MGTRGIAGMTIAGIVIEDMIPGVTVTGAMTGRIVIRIASGDLGPAVFLAEIQGFL